MTEAEQAQLKLDLAAARRRERSLPRRFRRAFGAGLRRAAYLAEFWPSPFRIVVWPDTLRADTPENAAFAGENIQREINGRA